MAYSLAKKESQTRFLDVFYFTVRLSLEVPDLNFELKNWELRSLTKTEQKKTDQKFWFKTSQNTAVGPTVRLMAVHHRLI